MPIADITSIDYQPAEGLMPVTFENQVTAVYFDVPLETYLALRFAPAQSAFFREQIMGRYHCSIG